MIAVLEILALVCGLTTVLAGLAVAARMNMRAQEPPELPPDWFDERVAGYRKRLMAEDDENRDLAVRVEQFEHEIDVAVGITRIRRETQALIDDMPPTPRELEERRAKAAAGRAAIERAGGGPDPAGSPEELLEHGERAQIEEVAYPYGIRRRLITRWKDEDGSDHGAWRWLDPEPTPTGDVIVDGSNGPVRYRPPGRRPIPPDVLKFQDLSESDAAES